MQLPNNNHLHRHTPSSIPPPHLAAFNKPPLLSSPPPHRHRPPSPLASSNNESFTDVMSNIVSALYAMQQQPKSTKPPSADVYVDGLSYQPPGSPVPLLQNVSMRLQPNCLGIIFGRSGAGKSTLLQVIAGLLEHSNGMISFDGSSGSSNGIIDSSNRMISTTTTSTINTNSRIGGLTAQQRMNRAGLVFQFPERHFVGATLADELTAGWPVDLSPAAAMARQSLTTRTYEVISAVGLSGLPLDIPLSQLSGGYKRRVALAVQLIRRPELMLLDEPLAGLDWRARGDVVQLLGELKKECTVLIVSHDLKELSWLCDDSWRMRRHGVLVHESLPDSY